MPRKSKISPAQRSKWLKRHEDGERHDNIAKTDKVNLRTVKEQIERARLERAFDSAQQQQLGEALRKHQDDLLGLLGAVHNALSVPPLEDNLANEYPSDSLDREDALPTASKFAGVSIISISPEPVEAAVRIVIRGGQPTEVRLAVENSRLWGALHEHLGSKIPLWHRLADWRRALLRDAQARPVLNQVIEKTVEAECGLPTLISSQNQKPYFTLGGGRRLVRAEVTRRAMGERPSDFPSRLQAAEGSLHDGRTSTCVAERLPEPEKVKTALTKIVEELFQRPEAKAAAKAHQDLEDSARSARNEVEDYLLLHHIPGRCSLCKKLGGQ